MFIWKLPLHHKSKILEVMKGSVYFSNAWRGVELCAGLLVGLAALQATLRSLRVFFSSPTSATGTEQVRLNLGRWLALALEFELAADILRTAVAPTWNEIGQLAAIIVLRTALNYFLQREIDHASDRAQHVEP
jgi:uncharacterized membrane protein